MIGSTMRGRAIDDVERRVETVLGSAFCFGDVTSG